MGTLKDGPKKKALDARQLSLKITANSVYGFTGNPFGDMPDMDVGATVTAIGRENLLETKRIVEENFEGAKCVAGDVSRLSRFALASISPYCCADRLCDGQVGQRLQVHCH
jgi:DNA polymerase elongation subunit (family B)